jgi:hypothetical protein
LAIVGFLQYLTLKSQAKWMKQNVDVTKGLVAESQNSAASAKESAKAATDTLTDYRKNTERELRAYVFTVFVEREKTPSGQSVLKKDPFIAKIAIKNAGRTPAHDCSLCIGLCFSNPALNETLSFPNRKGTEPHFVLPPDQTVIVPSDPLPLAPQVHQQIQLGTQEIHALGEITYTDVFGNIQHNKFHLRTSGAAYDAGEFIFCPGDNKAT